MLDPDDELLELAYVYGLDAVDETERRRIDDRIESADDGLIREFGAIVGTVREVMAIMTGHGIGAPPAQLRNRINAAIDDLERGSLDRGAVVRVRRRRRITVGVTVAAMVTIGLGAAAASGVFESAIPPTPTVAQVMHAPDAHSSTAPIAGGRLTIAMSQRDNAAVVLMSNVAPPPAGHVYQMWLVHPSGTTRLIGTMDATRMPPANGEVLTHIDAATTVTMTVEPGNGATQPSTPPIVSIPLAS